jgi:chromosome segregation ATPase
MIESAGRKDGSWIAELRRQATPAKTKGGTDLAAVERQIATYRQRIAKTEKQAGKDPKRAKGLEKQLARLNTSVEQWEKKLAVARKEQAAAMASSRLDTAALAEEVFLRTVSRPPSRTELAMARKDIDSAENQIDGVRDLLWAMLNTKEFIINH